MRMNRRSMKASNLHPGARIEHPSLGPGTVTRVDGQYVCVSFPEANCSANLDIGSLRPNNRASRGWGSRTTQLSATSSPLTRANGSKAKSAPRAIVTAPLNSIDINNDPSLRNKTKARPVAKKQLGAAVRRCDACGIPIDRKRALNPRTRFCSKACAENYRRNDRHTIQPDWR